MHFFSPANVMKLLEVVRGDKTAPDVLATVMALAKKISKVAVVAGVCHGFIGNRMLMPRQVEAMKLLMEGATPEQIDKVHVDFGMPMGPFQMSDLAGVDIGWHRDPTRIENIRDALAAEGRWGQKTKARASTITTRSGTRRPRRGSPRSSTISAAKSNVAQREITDEEIVERDALPDGQRRRADPRRRHGAARVRHRCGVDLRLWLAGLSRRADVLGAVRGVAEGRRGLGEIRVHGCEVAQGRFAMTAFPVSKSNRVYDRPNGGRNEAGIDTLLIC